MKVVILCGGLGTRLREETEFRPKPMVPVGGRPMLWHIMKYYAHHGHKDFILCLGYKGEVIKDYFRNYHWNTSDVTLKLGRSPEIRYHNRHDEEDWNVTLLDTGLLIHAPTFAWQIHIEAPRPLRVEDDYFDLLPGESRNIRIDGPPELFGQTVISALNAAAVATPRWTSTTAAGE